MANFPQFPGVLANEIDNTFTTSNPVKAGAAIIGPTVKGLIEVPIIVTSYSDYENRFGSNFVSGSDNYSFLTSIAAYNYFNSGGTSLLVARVASGSYTPATSSNIPNSEVVLNGNTASFTFNVSTVFTGSATASYATFRIDQGINANYIIPNVDFSYYQNNFDFYYTSSGANTNANYDNYINAVVSVINDPAAEFKTGMGITASYSSPNLTIKAINGGTSLNGLQISKSTTYNNTPVSIGTLSGGTANQTATALVLETISEGIIMNSSSSLDSFGALASGTKENIRWEVTNANTASGAFTLLVRRGDDKTNDKIILESYANVNLDPLSSRFISRVIGDQTISYNPTTNQIESSGSFPNVSRYVRVKSVNPTPSYLDNNGIAKSIYTSSIPINSNGAFSGATGTIKGGANFYEAINDSNTQGLVADNYDNMINLLSNPNAYSFNILMTPGLIDNLPSHTSKITTIITNTQERGDNIYLVDLADAESTTSEIITQASTRDTSYAAAYYPWVQIIDPSTGKRVFTPASTVVAGRYAFTDRTSKEWYAPAGKKRGTLNVLKPKFTLSEQNKTDLYAGKVNPIIILKDKSVAVFGQKTLQTAESALSSVNVRRLLIELKSYISQLADNLVFEQNTQATRNAFLAQVNPYLESVQQNLGLYAFKVIMDDSNNTSDLIDRNQLVGQFYIQPTRSIEFISLDFVLSPTGATFPA